ncbi:hypothetical protein AB1N83_012587 [Pleurotus pulmonarius]
MLARCEPPEYRHCGCPALCVKSSGYPIFWHVSCHLCLTCASPTPGCLDIIFSMLLWDRIQKLGADIHAVSYIAHCCRAPSTAREEPVSTSRMPSRSSNARNDRLIDVLPSLPAPPFALDSGSPTLDILRPCRIAPNPPCRCYHRPVAGLSFVSRSIPSPRQRLRVPMFRFFDALCARAPLQEVVQSLPLHSRAASQELGPRVESGPIVHDAKVSGASTWRWVWCSRLHTTKLMSARCVGYPRTVVPIDCVVAMALVAESLYASIVDCVHERRSLSLL